MQSHLESLQSPVVETGALCVQCCSIPNLTKIIRHIFPKIQRYYPSDTTTDPPVSLQGGPMSRRRAMGCQGLDQGGCNRFI